MPPRGSLKVDLSGRRFGRLVVIGFSHRTKNRRAMWKCRCDCGQENVVDGGNLLSGGTSSCGCLKSEAVRRTFTTHGHRARNTPEYESWSAVRARVAARSGRRFEDYAARGIACCDRWGSFESFLADMGPRPPGTSLDRIDNDGNYEPGNCRWATASQQVANRRRKPKRVATLEDNAAFERVQDVNPELAGETNQPTSTLERGEAAPCNNNNQPN